jgi:hypothetical protein
MSPLLPDVGEPLVFQAEWLRPTENDVHSRSRVQCLMLTFLRSSISNLLTLPNLKEMPQWSNFLETLKTLTSLDVCQPPPLRSALARLWVIYLYSGPTGQIFTAGSWLLEQLRVLSTNVPLQAAVFAECAGIVFAEFSKVLLPMAQDCANNLVKLCASHVNVNL